MNGTKGRTNRITGTLPDHLQPVQHTEHNEKSQMHTVYFPHHPEEGRFELKTRTVPSLPDSVSEDVTKLLSLKFHRGTNKQERNKLQQYAKGMICELRSEV